MKNIFKLIIIITLTISFANSTKAWSCGDTFTDTRDDKVYTTVQIGTQCWMAQNLNVGTLTVGTNTQGNDCPSAESIEKYCYSNNEDNCTAYGGLYQWDQAMCGSILEFAQGVCPVDWHIPTHDEFTILERLICTSGSCVTDFPYDSSTQGWRGTNEGTALRFGGSSGFSGLLGGFRETSGLFRYLNTNGTFWSSLQNSGAAWSRWLSRIVATIYRGNASSKSRGLSVRCVHNFFNPVIESPLSLSSTSIRWNFIDNTSTETGFKLYDNLNNLISTNATANLSYIDETNLSPNTQYSGRYVKAYNDGGESSASQPSSSIYTFAPTPTNLTATANLSTMSISTDAFPNHSLAQSGYYFESSSGNNSGWIQTNTWQETDLHYGKEYTYTVKYRNGDAIETSTISTTQSTPFASLGNVVIQPQPQPQPQQQDQSQTTEPSQPAQTQEPTPPQQEQTPPQEQLQVELQQQEQSQPQPTPPTSQQTQTMIIEIKAKIAELIAQLIALLQERINNR